jgi:REP element-mobilizing transposase RayT
MTDDACRLDHDQRRLVEETIADHCRIRGWTLYAVNCRSNHVHVVIAASRHPNEIREQFKAWCTRRLKAMEQERRRMTPAQAASNRIIRENWWAERGSGLYINDEEALEAIIHYVREAQDRPLDV